MAGGFKMDDYVDVAQRIHDFYERFPDGSLRTGTAPHVLEIAGKPFIAYHAQAFRTPDDPCPADGWAWEPVPGPTSFTKDSELMNAETAAWGRAIVALGFSTKKIASAQEVRARQGSGQGNPEPQAGAAEKPKTSTRSAASANGKERDPKFATAKQTGRLWAIAQENGVDEEALRGIIVKYTGQPSGAEIPKEKYDAICVAVQTYQLATALATGTADDIPF